MQIEATHRFCVPSLPTFPLSIDRNQSEFQLGGLKRDFMNEHRGARLDNGNDFGVPVSGTIGQVVAIATGHVISRGP